MKGWKTTNTPTSETKKRGKMKTNQQRRITKIYKQFILLIHRSYDLISMHTNGTKRTKTTPNEFLFITHIHLWFFDARLSRFCADDVIVDGVGSDTGGGGGLSGDSGGNIYLL